MQVEHMTPSVDMWSLGCLVVALVSGTRVFLRREEAPRKTGFALQVDMLGPITEQSWPGHTSLRGWTRLAAVAERPARWQTPRHMLGDSGALRFPLTQDDDPALELTLGILCCFPAPRLTAEAALQHRFCASSDDPVLVAALQHRSKRKPEDLVRQTARPRWPCCCRR